jgi:VanZ family protein
MAIDRQARRRKHFLHIGPAVVYIVTVFVVGSLPPRELGPSPFPGSDKLLHLVVFAGMFWVVLRALIHELPRMKASSKLFLAMFLTSAVGALLEVQQLAVPGRSAELLDWVADTLGALIVAFAVWRLVPGLRQASSGG